MNRVIKLLTKKQHKCYKLNHKTHLTCVQRKLFAPSETPKGTGNSRLSAHQEKLHFQVITRHKNHLQVITAKDCHTECPLSWQKSTSLLMIPRTDSFSGTKAMTASLSKMQTSLLKKFYLTTSRQTSSPRLSVSWICTTSQKQRQLRTNTVSHIPISWGGRKNFWKKSQKKRKLKLSTIH